METAIPRGQKTAEHYVTRFDHRFLLQGLALYVSLQQQQPESVLWVLCLDQEAENQLRDLNLPHLQALSLRSLETPALLQAKGNRSRAAELLEIWRPRLLRRMEALGITEP